MKKRWLRGMLLAVSLALLLSGGVALAQSLTVEPDCFQCFDGTYDEFATLEPGYPFSYIWDSCGWSPGETLLYTERFLAINELAYGENPTADGSGCVSSGDRWGWSCEGVGLHHRSQATADADEYVFPDDHWGLMQICLESGSDTVPVASALVCKDILFAEECPAVAAEFVPEPGSILLLGSGLAGLAGYATLRWRAKR